MKSCCAHTIWKSLFSAEYSKHNITFERESWEYSSKVFGFVFSSFPQPPLLLYSLVCKFVVNFSSILLWLLFQYYNINEELVLHFQQLCICALVLALYNYLCLVSPLFYRYMYYSTIYTLEAFKLDFENDNILCLN